MNGRKTMNTKSTTTETVVRTIKIPLESSEKKNERLQHCIGEFQSIMNHMADIFPSFRREIWKPRHNTLYRVTQREFDGTDLMKQVMGEAGNKVAESFSSWESNGCPGEAPSFGHSDYIIFPTQMFQMDYDTEGIKLKLEPYNPEWFGLSVGSYQQQFLDRVVDGDATTGRAEVHYNDGAPVVHLSVKWDVEVYEPDNVTTFVGVDIGENVLYSAGTIQGVSRDGGYSIEDVTMRTGGEFRHYRDQLDEQRRRLSEKGDLRAVKNCRGDRRRYTEQVVDEASKSIVEIADEHRPSCIVLEDLTNYWGTAKDPIHDWPFAMIQEKIMYKATEKGIPTMNVDPSYSSQTCRKCGSQDDEYRDSNEFYCMDCGYEVHADVNAALNIAKKGMKSV